MPGTSSSGGDRTLRNDGFPDDGQPIMPAGLSEVEKSFWSDLMEQIPKQLLRKIDVYQLRTLVELLALKSRLSEVMKADPTDLKTARLYLQASQQLNRTSAMFGLDPVSRARLKLQTEDGDDDFTKYMLSRMAGQEQSEWD